MEPGLPTIYVTQPIDEESVRQLAGRANVLRGFGPDAVPLANVIDTVDGILVRTERITAELIARASRLRVICRVGAGLEKIDIAAATAAGIPVFNSAGANARTVAEMTFALALGVLRQIPQWDRAVREGRFADRELNPGGELHGKTWGVVGFGHIGGEVARTAKQGFGMSVLAYHPRRDREWIEARGAAAVSELDELFERSDIVSLHVPLSENSRNLIGAAELARMRPSGVLVNMSRGGVVDESALYDALQSGSILGAAVDVFAEEPPSLTHPLFSLENIVLSPHRGGRTREATQSQGRLAVGQIMEVLRGRSLEGAVNEAELRINQGNAQRER